jgi:hypothetical protein
LGSEYNTLESEEVLIENIEEKLQNKENFAEKPGGNKR